MPPARVGPIELLLALLAGATLAFVGGEAARAYLDETRQRQSVAMEEARRRENQRLAASRDVRELPSDAPRAPERVSLVPDPENVLARLAVGTGGTYISDLIEGQDSVLYRWSDRTIETLRVWVQSRSVIKGWKPTFVPVARDAFPEWGAAGFPVRFTFTLDSASADVRLMWIDQFPGAEGQRVGRADRQVDGSGWIRRADLFVALHDSTGRAIPSERVAAIVRHEVGHALGLGHTRDSTSIMYPSSRTAVISPADRATLRFLYTLPPGSLRRGAR